MPHRPRLFVGEENHQRAILLVYEWIVQEHAARPSL